MKLWTDILDVIGIVLLAAGAAYATYPYVGMACLAVAGGVVLAGSGLATHMDQPKSKRDDR